MRKKLTKAEFDKLSDEMKANYKLVGTDYVLELEDDDDEPPASDATAAKTAIERKHRKAAEKARDELQAKLDALEIDATSKSTDVASIKASYDRKIAKLEKDRDEAQLTYKNYVGKTTKDTAAADIAGKLTKTPKVILPHILSRLEVDFSGDEPALVVLDSAGKKSAATLDDLTKEFRDNKDFAGIVIASQANGGGASRPGVTAPSGSALVTGQNPATPVNLSKLSAPELVAQVKQRQAERAERRQQSAAVAT